MSNLLIVTNLRKTYGDMVAVDSVSFAVRPNEIVGLLGPNGAGKTTTINMILGLLEPTSGNISIEGIDLGKQRLLALQRVNFAAIYAPLPGNLTVSQNLRIFGQLYGIQNLRARIESLIEFFELGRLRHLKCGVLSSGEQSRVSLAKAMLNSPRLLVLDEPTASLDPTVARSIRNKIRCFAKQGTGVVWTSHNMHEVEDICDRILFLSEGKVVIEGDPRTLPCQHRKATLEDLFVSMTHERSAS